MNAPLLLSEQHPREQGLKHRLVLDRERDTTSFRATSKRTRIETQYRRWPSGNSDSFRATSKRTRIETFVFLVNFNAQFDAFRATSKRTRIETDFLHQPSLSLRIFQSNIQENKDWNLQEFDHQRATTCLSEQHPREQGLKLQCVANTGVGFTLSEQHPREQGLKHATHPWSILPFLLSEQHPREQGLKLDWFWIANATLLAFRATSKRTRIETRCWLYIDAHIVFQSNIQENKDWNWLVSVES